MPFWTFQNIAEVTRGRWLLEPDDLRDDVVGLWHDTRDLQPGQAYLAIKGDNFDGHDFLNQAFAAGAALAIVSETPTPNTQHLTPILKVDDTVKALQDLACSYRDELKQGGCTVIGIAGSNGKTTTRHLIHHVLTHAGFMGTQSPKSFNNHLGVPLTLLQALPSDDFVACEIGTNHPGEIDFLSAIAKPDIAVITSIGEEHLEFFKTVANVAREEASIMSHVVENGWVMVPIEDWDRHLKKRCAREDLSVAHGPDVPFLDGVSGMWITYGPHMRSNANLAAITAMRLGIDEQQIESALHSATLPSGRCERMQFSSVTVIHDAYNANPSSTRASIEMLSWCSGRRVLVFGDMLELGEHALDAHRSIGIQAETAELDHLVTVGELAKHAALAIETMQVDRFDTWTDATPDDIADLLEPGDTVLLKASRGMRLERLIPAIERRFGPRIEESPT
ncbi:MAG: UDP-N-acetylmuramoyl-tripeptide--D-alanyl-D-alanine ligase [Phycisphaeraceae bacterium]